MIGNYFAPPTLYTSQLPNTLPWQELNWLHEIKGNTFFALWLRGEDPDLPLGHDLYFVSYHMEPLDYDWLLRQSKRISGQIIVINDGTDYNAFDKTDNIHFFTFYSWHYQLEQLQSLWTKHAKRNPVYKVSAINNRITQSKLLVFTAIMEYVKNPLVKLGTWLEEKNVHYREKTQVAELDHLQDIFFNKYYGKTIEVDEFNQSQNSQRYNSNPFSVFLTDAALHFSLESYHYSQMIDHIRPGPCLTEKTLKCLAGGTPFIPVGQFDIVNNFERLGFRFDYGPLDLSFDKDPGNLTRLKKIVNLVKTIEDYTIDDIVDFTRDPTLHNLEHVQGNNFNKICKSINEKTAENVLEFVK